MVNFQSGRLSAEAYQRRRDATTAEQLALLTADSAFASWQLKKAARDNRARVASNALAVVGCVLLVVTMALLKPAAVGQEVASYRLQAVQRESEVALDAISDLTIQLRLAEEAHGAAAARLEVLEAEQAAARAMEQTQQSEAALLVADMTVQLEQMKAEVAAAEAASEAAAALAEAAVAASEALGAASAATPLLPPPTTCPAPSPFEHVTIVNPSPGGAWPSISVGPHCNSSLAVSALAATALFSTDGTPTTALYTFLASLGCAALAVLTYLRGRRAAACEAERATQMAARLKEASFARDTAEQSLTLLEAELQRRMKQLDEAQQRAADATSPKIGTMPAQHTPGKGELPPPPASLIEDFLRSHSFMAVQQEQMQEWLEMEHQFGEMQAALAELQAALTDKDAQIAALEQDFSAVHEHGRLEVRALEDQLSQVKAWLNEAQEELLNTQAALQEREMECRRVTGQLEAMRVLAAGAQASEGHGPALLRQNLELVAQLQTVNAAYEEMQAQLSSTGGTSLALTAFGSKGLRPASATSTLPGTPAADLTCEVQSCLDIMRATRVQLADRLAHSAGVCKAMIDDCQKQSLGERGVGAAADDNDQALEAFGSPAVASPSASEQEEREGACTPLGVSRLHHANLPPQQASSPAKKAQAQPGRGGTSVSPSSCSVDGSMRAAWEAAHARVAEVRAQHTSWDLAGFVQGLGFEIEEVGVPADRADFLALKASLEAALEASATGASSPQKRALAGEAMQVLRDWEWPATRINTPPPSPFWRMLGLQA
ncbi:hypothetical protein CHLNCDRAFT_58496 [Chlorella variabilis]|uniref:Uncharacterized protein n=1 Tax=Chlorella variabilis TaxID=554065 RepID=E1ZKM0_CHLVA|nr:hypothetical protein CHLNCDRAFT_58496 [Chlorella variabilis]EFN53829.1 hypothetical protein CHLNCDRAFT_58496 [Chlorella variabilis]|eukprot:XP_005845931.1 hypothetical protein CHLNCDRAFT_58496 [Chlorella variabilis]